MGDKQPLLMEASEWEELLHLWQALRSMRGGGTVKVSMVPGVGVTISGSGSGGKGGATSRSLVYGKLVEQFNNYVQLARIDPQTQQVLLDDQDEPITFFAAKPFKLRHVVDNYAWPTSLATVGPGQVDVTSGSDTHRWEHYPDDFQPDELLLAFANVQTGLIADEEVEHADAPITYELPAGVRAWCVPS